MAGKYNTDNTVEAVIDVLTRLSPAKFNTIDSEINDGILLADVAKWYRAPELENYDSYPSCVVTAQGFQIPDPLRAENIKHHEIQLVLWVCSIDATDTAATLLPQETMTKQLERMIRGFIEVFEDQPTLANAGGTDQVDHALVVSGDLSDFDQGERGITRGARLSLLCFIDV